MLSKQRAFVIIYLFPCYWSCFDEVLGPQQMLWQKIMQSPQMRQTVGRVHSSELQRDRRWEPEYVRKLHARQERIINKRSIDRRFCYLSRIHVLTYISCCGALSSSHDMKKISTISQMYYAIVVCAYSVCYCRLPAKRNYYKGSCDRNIHHRFILRCASFDKENTY